MTQHRWVFVAGKPFLPDAADPFSAGLGGTEQAIIHLTSALAALGDIVTVAGAATTARTLNGVTWQPGAPPDADTHVAVNDATLLPRRAVSPIVWFHNEVVLLKEFRRARLRALMHHRPASVFIGTEQARRASPLFPFRTRHVIPYGLSDRILRAPVAEAAPPMHALFTSQAYRGLRDIIAMWQSQIAPHIAGATLTAYIANADVPAYRSLATHPGITISPRIGNDAILAELGRTRILLAPGHVSETFCLAAAEAIALGVPVVTLGTGSLKERVRNGQDGYICRNYSEMATRSRLLLTDDALWLRFSANGRAARAGNAWTDIAARWQSLRGRLGATCRPPQTPRQL